MRRQLVLAAAVLSLTVVVPVHGQTSTPVPILPKPGPDSTLIALRAQLAEMRETRQDILSTVQWALGVAGAIAFLLVGYSWFTNSRSYERDKISMRAALKNDATEDFRELRKQLEDELARQRTQLEQVAAAVVRKEVSELTKSLASAKNSIKELREEVIELQIERGEERHESWTVLPGRLALLRMRREEGWEMRVADQLELLSKALHEDWFTLDADDASKIMAEMDALKSTHAADADAIRARVRQLRAPAQSNNT